VTTGSGRLRAPCSSWAPTLPRIAGSALSCFGAAILMRPEAGIELGSVFALVGGALLGTYLAATRGARSQTDALSTLAFQSLLGSGLLAPFAFAHGLPALTPALLVSAAMLGGISAACHFLTVAAYQRVDAAQLAPFLYFNLITAMVVGFVWFGETVSGVAMLGLVAIALGGLTTLVEPGRLRALAPMRLRLA